MNRIPKVLVCAPTNRVKDYCAKDFANVLRGLTYPNHDVYLVDNSPDSSYAKHLREMGIDCGWLNPAGMTNRQYMCASQEALRQKAVKEGYDFMFNLETDMFPPCRDVIERLMLAHKTVVSGIYHILTGRDSHLCISLPYLPQDDINVLDTVMLRGGLDTEFVDGNVKQVFQAGLGCTLIHRTVFEKIRFRVNDQDFHADTWFYIDLHKAGIKAWADTAILCEHRNQKWKLNLTE